MGKNRLELTKKVVVIEKDLDGLRKRLLRSMRYNLKRHRQSELFDSEWLENYPKWKTKQIEKYIEYVKRSAKRNPRFYWHVVIRPKEYQKTMRKEYGKEFDKRKKDLILKRDNSTCRKCGSTTRPLDIHHIDHNKKNNDLSNLITLCKICHGKIHH